VQSVLPDTADEVFMLKEFKDVSDLTGGSLNIQRCCLLYGAVVGLTWMRLMQASIGAGLHGHYW
jgi:hypothetical protein